jgi:hypothetical protein
MEMRMERKKTIAKRWEEYGNALQKHYDINKKIKDEREKANNLFNSLKFGTNNVPPSAGLMTVTADELAGEIGVDSDGKPLPEDENVEPQRPVDKEKKSSWFKRLFSSE